HDLMRVRIVAHGPAAKRTELTIDLQKPPAAPDVRDRGLRWRGELNEFVTRCVGRLAAGKPLDGSRNGLAVWSRSTRMRGHPRAAQRCRFGALARSRQRMSDLKFWIVFAGLLCALALTIV